MAVNLKPYVTKIGKERNYALTDQAKATVQSLVSSTVADLTHATHVIMELSNRATITYKLVNAAVSIIYKGELLNGALDAGNDAVNTFNKNNNTLYNRKEQQANLTLSVSRVRSLIKQSGFDYSISDQATVYLTGVLEYLIGELLSVAEGFKRNKRITADDLVSATENDSELSVVFNRL